MRRTCLLFPNMRLHLHNLDFHGCDRERLLRSIFFLPRVFSCSPRFCIKRSRVNICTSMCDTTLVRAVQLPLRRIAWWERGDGQECSSCLEVCSASSEEDVEVWRDNLFMGHTRMNPFRSPHIWGRNLEEAETYRNLLGKFWVRFLLGSVL